MATKSKKLYGVNIDARDKFINLLIREKISGFRTQSILYKALEEIKFPYLKNWASIGDFPHYAPVNYTPIVDWLLDRGILTKHRIQNRIVYFVNQSKLSGKINYSPIYNI
jgi:hypothetical protein